MSETPFVDNAVLKIDGSGLACSRAPTSVEAMVGFDLSRGLPGWHGAISVDVVQGSTTVSAHGSTSFGQHLRINDYIRVRNVVYQIVGKNAANTSVTLSIPYAGDSETGVGMCDFGVTVPGRRSRDLSSAVVASFDPSRVGKASYTITSLAVGVPYAIRVFARNERGLSLVRESNPGSASPPQQKPDSPTGVRLVGDTDKSLKVLFFAPDSDGGATVSFGEEVLALR